MTYAIEILEKELAKLNQPLKEDEEEDYLDAVINFRATSDIKIALKILNEFKTNSKLLNL